MPVGTSANVEIEVPDAQVDDPESAVIVHRGADGWTIRETTVRDVGDGTVTLTASVDSFSLFAVVERPSSRTTGQTPTPAPATAAEEPGSDAESTPPGETRTPEPQAAVETTQSTSSTEPDGFDPALLVVVVLVGGVVVAIAILRRRDVL